MKQLLNYTGTPTMMRAALTHRRSPHLGTSRSRSTRQEGFGTTSPACEMRTRRSTAQQDSWVVVEGLVRLGLGAAEGLVLLVQGLVLLVQGLVLLVRLRLESMPIFF